MPDIMNYTYQPDPRRWMDAGGFERDEPDGGARYIGVELEVELKSTDYPYVYLEDVARITPYASELGYYLKHDSSLRNGFELVTHPRTMDRWLEDKSKWHALFAWLVRNKVVSYDSGRCGMHVHLSKNHFASPAHAVRFAAFFHQNAAFSYALSRRKPSTISTYAQLKSVSANMFEGLSFASWPSLARAPVFDHHACMAFSRYDTLEVRLFRGTLNTESFYGYLNMVSALTEYTKKTMLHKQSLDEFQQFCGHGYQSVARLVEVAKKRSASKKSMEEMQGLVHDRYSPQDLSLQIGIRARSAFKKKTTRVKRSPFAEAVEIVGSAASVLQSEFRAHHHPPFYLNRGHGMYLADGSEDYYTYMLCDSGHEYHTSAVSPTDTVIGVSETAIVSSRMNTATAIDTDIWNDIKYSGILEKLDRRGLVLRAHRGFNGRPREEWRLDVDYATGILTPTNGYSDPGPGRNLYLVVYDKELDLPVTTSLYLG